MFQGVWPALVTPTNADHSLNVPALRQLIDYLIGKGVNGFYVGGSTGDGILMPVAQRKLLAECALAHVAGRVPVIIHVGATSSDDAIELSRHAYKHDAIGVSSIIPPLYDNIESLYEYYRAIAQAVPNVPILAYLLNPIVDSITLMCRLMTIPNMVGVKYTGSNMHEFRQIIDLGRGQWTAFSGMDEQAIYGCMMGATGIIGSTLNFMPGVYIHIRRYVQEARYDEAQELQVKANRVITQMEAVGFKGALKAVLTTLMNIDFGSPRLPGLPLTNEQQSALEERLAQTDFKMLTAL